MPSHGLMTAELQIRVSPDANYTKTHIIPIHATLSLPDIFIPVVENKSGSPLHGELGKGIELGKTTYVSTTVAKPLEVYERIERGLKTWGSPITTFLTIIVVFGSEAAVVIPGIKYLKSSKKP